MIAGLLIIRNEKGSATHKEKVNVDPSTGVLYLDESAMAISRTSYDFGIDSFSFRPKGGKRAHEVDVNEFTGVGNLVNGSLDFQIEDDDMKTLLEITSTLEAERLSRIIKPKASTKVRPRI